MNFLPHSGIELNVATYYLDIFIKVNTMEENMTLVKKTARIAGLLYLMMILAALYAHVYVPSQILVRGNAEATAKNILSDELLFRTCIVVSLIEATIFLFLAFNLYRLLKNVNSHFARIMVALITVQIPVALLVATFKLTALMILKNDPAQFPGLAMQFLGIVGYANAVLSLFTGLWLFPFGLLLYKSRLIPTVFGLLLVISGTGHTVFGLISILFPGFGQSPLPAYIFFGLGEIPIMLWLLIKGVKDHVSIEIISERETKQSLKFEV